MPNNDRTCIEHLSLNQKTKQTTPANPNERTCLQKSQTRGPFCPGVRTSQMFERDMGRVSSYVSATSANSRTKLHARIIQQPQRRSPAAVCIICLSACSSGEIDGYRAPGGCELLLKTLSGNRRCWGSETTRPRRLLLAQQLSCSTPGSEKKRTETPRARMI